MTKKKIPIVLQNDIKDCGVCSLQSIIKYYDGYVSLEKMREDTYTTKEGTTLYHLKKAAERYGFDAIAKKYPDKIMKSKSLPAIVHVKYQNGLTHFMCLYELNQNKVVLMDPSKGKIIMKYEDFINIFTGVVLELYPKNTIIYLKKGTNIFNLFLDILFENKKLCLNIFISSILCTVFTICSSLYFKVRYEYYLQNKLTGSIKIIIYLFLILAVSKLIYEFRKLYFENHLNKNIDVKVYENFISHIFKLPLRVINNRSTGEILSRISDLNQIKSLFTDFFTSFILDIGLFFGTLIICLLLSFKLTIVLCFVIILYVIVSLIVNPYLYKRIKNNIDLETEMNSVLVENVDMIESIKNLDRTSNALEKIENSTSEFIYDNYTFIEKINYINLLKNSILDLGLLLVNSIGFAFIGDGKISLVDLVVFNTLLFYLIDPIKNVIALLLKYNFLRASFNKICDFIDIEEEKIGIKDNFVNGNICFKEVEYSYNNYSKILNKVSFTIGKGDKVMIKGKSGSGKSTICQMLIKNIMPISGTITINDKNINDYSIKTIKNNIVYIGQHERLYSDTIKNNILLYSNNNKLFDKICEICCVDEIVDKKFLRYDFGIDTVSSNISGGERQRIALARALLSPKSIIVIDEALSETDKLLECRIIDNIIKEFPTKTVIYISHKEVSHKFDYVIDLSGDLHET